MSSRKNSGASGTASGSSSANASRKGSVEDTEDAGAQAAADVEVDALMRDVKASMSNAKSEDFDVDTGEQEEVKMTEHLDMQNLTLDENNSASNSIQASPAAGAAADDTTAASKQALESLPEVELKDGGNASLEPSASSGAGKKDFYDVRVAIVGNVDSGKSTLIGVLTGGQLDDGRGKARSKVFIHAHELGTGRTSAISQHLLGFDHEGQPVHQTVAASAQSAAKSKSWASVVAASRSLMTFIDLAGHEKYLSTTIAGLTGSHPDYACVLVNSLAGVTKMTKEHLGVVLALEIPLICVVTKVDLVPTTVLEQSKKQLFRILKSSAANKLPIQMRSEKDVDTVIENSKNSNKICPVFFISAVNGTHVNLLTHYLSRLRPHLEWLSHYASNLNTQNADGTQTSHPNACEFAIDEVFNVSGVGIVVSGTLQSGTLTTGSTLLLGPQSDNTFVQVLVRSLHYKRVLCNVVEAGQSCAVSIRAVKRKETLKRDLIRRGMVLVDPVVEPKSTRVFDAEVLILHHPTTIKLGYQAVLHAGMIRQTAGLVRIQKQCLRTGDKSLCRFRFLQREEYLHTGQAFVFREGSTKGIGKIVRIAFSDAEIQDVEQEEAQRKRNLGRTQPRKSESAAAGSGAAGEPDNNSPSNAADAADDTSTATAAAPSASASSSSSSAAKKEASGREHSAQKAANKDEEHASSASSSGKAGGKWGKDKHHK